MTAGQWALVALGGAVGAPARYLLDKAVRARVTSRLPLGTLAVNVLGAFVLGVLAGGGDGLSRSAYALLGTGFCGALTTFSTFSTDNLTLVESGRARAAAMNVALTLGCGIAAAALGWWVTAH